MPILHITTINVKQIETFGSSWPEILHHEKVICSFNTHWFLDLLFQSNNGIITGKFSGASAKEIVFREREIKTVAANTPEGRVGDPTPNL